MVPPSLQIPDFLPVLFKFSFFLGKDHHAFAILQALDEHVYDISGIDRLDVVKFVPGIDPRFCSRCRRALPCCDFLR